MNQSVRVMRALLLFLFIVLSWNSGFTQEKYFHDLRGMEDSTGTTHLFYRMYKVEPYTAICDDYEQTFQSSWNSVYHLNLDTASDSVYLEDYSLSGSCIGYDLVKNVIDYDFFDNDIAKWIANGFAGCSGMSIWDYQNRKTQLPSYCITKSRPKEYNFSSNYSFILSENQDSLFLEYVDLNFKFTLSDSIYPQFNNDDYLYFQELVDTLADGPAVFAINPYYDSIYYSKNDDWNLMVSENYSQNFHIVDSLFLIRKIAFDTDSTTVYAITTTKYDSIYVSGISISNDKGLPNTWSETNEIIAGEHLTHIETDDSNSGQLYVTSYYSVFKSDDKGESFYKLFTSHASLKGLYKKTDSDILYVLTTEELIEFNVSTNEQTVLKVLPVSAEVEPEQPKTITLHQNYPNPFNPSTVISYQLTGNSMVSLRVFDALGREVAVLVDELKSAGRHQVTFDAAGLASGVYYYVLNADEQILTKKLTLIK